jgi:hypothetical protein
MRGRDLNPRVCASISDELIIGSAVILTRAMTQGGS